MKGRGFKSYIFKFQGFQAWSVSSISGLGLGLRILAFRARGYRFRLQGFREGLVAIQVKIGSTGLGCEALHEV